MKKYVTSRKYAHISISSLHLLAQRAGLLFCSIDSWYKYIRYFGWARPWRIEKRKIRKVGIRAAKPNEIWHLDVTVVNLGPQRKLYIQAVIDNFSRFVLAWRVTDSISGVNTIETLNLAKKNAARLSESKCPTHVMMDPGSENNNRIVSRFMPSRNLIRILARVEVRYSNSMIESLFRGLKNNYLYHQGIRTIEDLERKANFYFAQHNNIVPHATLQGATPAEVYQSVWNQKNLEALKSARTAAIVARAIRNRAPVCSACPHPS